MKYQDVKSTDELKGIKKVRLKKIKEFITFMLSIIKKN